MNTTTDPAGEKSWWERLTEQSQDADATKGLLKYVIIAAIAVTVGIAGWQFFQSSKQGEASKASDLIQEGIALLPAPRPQVMGTTSEGMGYYSTLTSDLQQRAALSGAVVQPEDAKSYVDKVDSVLATFDEKESELTSGDQAWLYWHVRQQLLFYASRNVAEASKKADYLTKQLSILDKLEKDFADAPALAMKPDTNQPEKTVITLWRDLAQKDLEFFKKYDLSAKIAADPGLKATLTLENDKTIVIEFYSRLAPKSVASFLANSLGSFYDGTAVHAIDKAEKTISFGSPMSKLAPERKAIWDNDTGHYKVPTENNPLLPATKGAVSLSGVGVNCDGFYFNIHMEDSETPTSGRFTVFGRVVEGLDNLQEWYQTEVHDEAGLKNPNLPRVRLGLKSVAIEGKIAHPSTDSWKPNPKLPEVPEVTDQEKTFYEAIKPVETPAPNEETKAEEGN